MNKNFSDEQLDKILHRIVKDSLPDEAAISEIADSPKLRWSLQSRIEREKPKHKKGWIPTFDWRIAAFASLAFVVCAGIISFINFEKNDFIAAVESVDSSITETSKADEKIIVSEPETEAVPEISVNKNLSKTSPKKFAAANIKPKSNVQPKHRIKETEKNKPSENLAKVKEIKTDFIALSYSPTPESGQILKVRVPRSMMVSLGVAANMENSSRLVNAEVLMGDDGLARAIRFVQ